MPPPKIKESQIEAKVVRFCRQNGLYCRKFSSPSNRGVPDRIIGRDGVVLFLELKRPGEQPTPLQRRELTELACHRLLSNWADSYSAAVAIIRRTFKLPPPVDPQSLI